MRTTVMPWRRVAEESPSPVALLPQTQGNKGKIPFSAGSVMRWGAREGREWEL